MAWNETMPPVTRADRSSRPASRSPSPSARVDRWWASLPTSTRVVLVVLPVVLAAFASWGFGEVIGQHHRQFDLRLYYDAINFWQSGHDLFSYSQPDAVNIRLGFTYPPLAAVLMTPMAWVSYAVVKVVWLAGIIAATAAFGWVVLRERFAYPRQLMVALVGVGTAAAFLLEPFRQTLSFGQINIFLGLLVVVDLLVLGRRGSRWTGVGIGLAAAIKLTPGIFIVYLLVVGRWRAAITAMSAAVGFTLLGAFVTPTETWKYFTSLIWETSRVGFIDTTLNQSINGLLARLAAPLEPKTDAVAAVGARARGVRLVAGPPRRVRRGRTRGHHAHGPRRHPGQPRELGASRGVDLPRPADPRPSSGGLRSALWRVTRAPTGRSPSASPRWSRSR